MSGAEWMTLDTALLAVAVIAAYLPIAIVVAAIAVRFMRVRDDG